MWFKTKNKTALERQIQEYADWKRQHVSIIVGNKHYEYLQDFLEYTEADTVRKITLEEVNSYLSAKNRPSYVYLSRDAGMAIRGLFRYFKARGYPCINPVYISG